MSGFDLNRALFLDGVFIPGPGSDGSLSAADGPRAVHFSGNGGTGGTGLYRTAALVGVGDGSFGLCSFWFKSTDTIDNVGIYTALQTLNSHGRPDSGGSSTGLGIDLNFDAGIALADAAGTNFENYDDPTEYRDGNWHHALFAWNLLFAAGSRVTQLAIDGALVSVSGTNSGIAFAASYSNVGPCLGASGFDDATNAAQFTSTFDLAEFYLNTVATLDLSVGANILKYRTAGGHPADLGADGSTPTGSAPAIYLGIAARGDAATTFLTNKGTGGNFLMVNGLSVAATDPF